MSQTAAWYRRFGEVEAKGSSPQYERLAEAVAASEDVLRWLAELPPAKRQPNLLFASVRLLGGPTESALDFVEYVIANRSELTEVMLSRSTQTNEVARTAAFLPFIAQLDREVALIEVGASAGLCLFPDRYGYSYDGRELGESSLLIEVETHHTLVPPERVPDVVWRRGLDLNPLDVSNQDHLAWLRACIWPEHDDRRRRFDLAAAIVATDPPKIEQGDLLDATRDLIEQAPANVTKVVFHSAVLAYVDGPGREAFAAMMGSIVESRDDVVWLSNEAPSVVPGLVSDIRDGSPVDPGAFLLGRNGTELLAHTDPHGQWMRCTARSGRSTAQSGGK